MTQRINGFAPGDRVAIVNCELAGAYGKVRHSAGGCTPNLCRDKCHLVWIELMSIPKNLPSQVNPMRETYNENNTYRFLPNEVTHVD